MMIVVYYLIDVKIIFYNFLLQVMAVLKFRHPLQNSNKWTIVARASYPQNQGMHQKYDYPVKRTAQKWYFVTKIGSDLL